ncbi:DsbE family thiol:disulfide interchange protein [Hyphomicrobium sp.]|uniref:DsbE family thiol:disulfide interchange protein n=1 Tax=Hyphomicrobium sp. TaxID=82 RepID=UPI002D76F0AC|nr:DsbE family thiol:disulfide interchange protein [Hyphomicrobium sp.]HET6388784.1 DsbE family thiol:disulfide interchange protein [Hyphomicrobium sp.]
MADAKPKSPLLRALPVVIFAVVAGFFAMALRSGDPSRLPSTLVGKPAPQTTFPALAGLEVGGQPQPGFSSADLAKGKVSVVNYWASWCQPCVDEHPFLMQLKEQAGVDLYGVNYKDKTDAARRFMGRFGNPYSAVGTDSSGRAAIDWGVYGTPETFVVNGRGEVIYKHVGPISAESLKTKLLPVIEKAKADAAAS